MEVLVVNGFGLEDDPTPVERLAAALASGGHHLDLAELAIEGFDAPMSAAEREAYHSDQPLITPETKAAAEAVKRAEAIVVSYPIIHGTFPPRVKSWVERVFVRGVGFEFLPSGRITGALHHVERACVVGVGSRGRAPRLPTTMARFDPRQRNAPGPSLARSFFLSSNRRCRSRYLEVTAEELTPATRFLAGW